MGTDKHQQGKIPDETKRADAPAGRPDTKSSDLTPEEDEPIAIELPIEEGDFNAQPI